MSPEQLKRLQRLKENSKLTNKALAEASGTTESTVSRILSGESKDPSFDIVYNMITAMKGSVEEVLNGTKKTEDESVNLINAIREIYEAQIRNERKDKMYLAALVFILVIFILGLFTVDLMHGDIGWFRY